MHTFVSLAEGFHKIKQVVCVEQFMNLNYERTNTPTCSRTVFTSTCILLSVKTMYTHWCKF